MMRDSHRPIPDRRVRKRLPVRALRLGAAFVGLLGGATVAGAQDATELVRTTLAADVQAIRPGETFHLALVLEIAPEWHTYWENPGASGAPPRISVQAPAGFVVGATRFPRPVAFAGEEGTTFGYERQTVFLVPVTAPAAPSGGAAAFRVDFTYLVCRAECLIGTVERRLELPLEGGRPRPALDARTAGAIDRAKARLPRPLDPAHPPRVRLVDDRIDIELDAAGFAAGGFLPIDRPGVTYGAIVATVSDGRLRIQVPVEIRPHNAIEGTPFEIRGLITLGARPEDPSFLLVLPLANDGTLRPTNKENAP